MAARTVTIQDASVSNLTTSAQTVLAANGTRSLLIIQNLSDVNISVSLTGTAAVSAAAGTITLAPLGALVFSEAGAVPGGAVSIIAASGSSKTVSVLWA